MRKEKEGYSTGEILAEFKGLTRWQLYYFTGQRILNPKKISKGKKDELIFSEKDFEKLNNMYQYLKQGISPKVAYEKALEISGQKRGGIESDIRGDIKYARTPLEIILRNGLKSINIELPSYSFGFGFEKHRNTIFEGEEAKDNLIMVDTVIEHWSNWIKTKSDYLYAISYGIVGLDKQGDVGYPLDIDKKIKTGSASTIREIILSEVLSSPHNYNEVVIIHKRKKRTEWCFPIFYECGKASQCDDVGFSIREFKDLNETLISPENLAKRVVGYMRKIAGAKK